MMNWLEQIAWNEQGLIPVIAQDAHTGTVLMFAWMNRKLYNSACKNSARCIGHVRAIGCGFKGEESGHIQHLKDIRLDCDNDI